jgi:hypothetical protein
MRKIADATYGEPPSNPVRRRLVRARRWFLLDANRWLVTGVMLLATFVAIVVVGTFGPIPTESFLTVGISPGAVLVELLKMIASVVVIVLSINQLVLSPGLGPVGDQQDRFEQTMDLREKIEDNTNVQTSPTSPADILRVLVGEIGDQAEQLGDATAEIPDRQLRVEVESYAEGVVADADRVERQFAASRFGQFETISASLRFAISEKVQALRDVRKRYEATSSTSETEAFDDLYDLLRLFTVTREYLKTGYIRSAYIELSQGLLYIGLPSIVLTYCAAQIYSPAVFPGEAFGIDFLLIFVSGAVTVALAPFVLLLSYVFRLATLSRSTVFIGPFAARSSSERQSSE